MIRVPLIDVSWNVEVVWESSQLKSKLSSFTTFKNHAYGFDNGIFACLDLTDGQRGWKRGHYGHGQVLLVGDKLLIQAESGEIVLLEANSDQLRELARFPALTSKTWNYPALAGRILVVRNDREAAAYEMPLLN